jgi:hypothetical protein
MRTALLWIITQRVVSKMELIGCPEKSVRNYHYTLRRSSEERLASLVRINTFNAQLNPICHLLALLGAHHILHVSR